MSSNKANIIDMDNDLKFIPLDLKEPFKSKDSSWAPSINIDIPTNHMTNNFFMKLPTLQNQNGFTPLPPINNNDMTPYSGAFPSNQNNNPINSTNNINPPFNNMQFNPNNNNNFIPNNNNNLNPNNNFNPNNNPNNFNSNFNNNNFNNPNNNSNANNILAQNELYPSETLEDELYSYNENNPNNNNFNNPNNNFNNPNNNFNNPNNNFNNTDNNLNNPNNNFNNPDSNNSNNSRSYNDLLHLELLRNFDFSLDSDVKTDSRSGDNSIDVDKVFSDIEDNNNGLITTLNSYGIPSPIANLTIKKIIKVTLDNSRKE